MQGLFRQLGLPYVGSDVLASVLGMDKDLMKAILREKGQGKINTAEYLCFQKDSTEKEGSIPSFEDLKQRLDLPFYIKAARQGSSIGVHRVNTQEEFHQALTDAFFL